MPSFLTHCLFAEDTLDLIEEDAISQEIKNRMALYYLGAQGPDIFFYYKAKPWVKYDGIEKLGHLMHDNKTADFLVSSFEYIRKKREAGNADKFCTYFDLMAYIAGYLCHFALDQAAHPLIHYWAGIDTQGNKKTHKYHNYHKLLENIIDVYMLDFKKRTPAHMYKSYILIEGSKKHTGCLGALYSEVIKKVYGIEITVQQAGTAVTDMIEILKIFYDPFGFKRVFFKFFEFLINKKGEITTAMHPRHIDSRIDYLNLNHDTYCHPCSKDIEYSKSFLDLYEEGLLLAGKFINAAIKYMMDKDTISKIKNIIPDISYSKGLKCGTDKDLVYFDSIFERKYSKQYEVKCSTF